MLAIVLILSGAWAYSTSFAGVLVLDDVRAIARNASIRTLWPLSTPLSPPSECTVAGRPIANLSLAINYALAPSAVRNVFSPGPSAPDGAVRRDDFLRNIWGYHFFNLVIHLGCALVLFGVTRRTLLSERLEPVFGTSAAWVAFATALLWVVHPLTTTAVTYVVQRVESLMALFYLVTLYSAIRVEAAATTGRASGARAWSVAAVAACGLGMATKEVMVTAPLVVWLWYRTFGGRKRTPRGLLLGLSATWLVLAALVYSEHRAPSVDLQAATVWPYLATQTAVVAHYLRLVVVPAPLIFLYTWPIARSLVAVAPQAVVMVALVALILLAVVRRNPLGFAGASFFLILAPTSSVLPIITEVAAEQRMYLPLAAVLAAAVAGTFLIGRRCLAPLATDARLRFRLGAGISGLALVPVVLILGSMTRERNRQYTAEIGLWQVTLAAQPDNQRARLAYGVALMSERRFADAERELQHVVDADSFDWLAHSRLGAAQAAQGKLDSAIVHLERAVALRPDAVDAHRWLAQAYVTQHSDSLALAHFNRALAAQQDDVAMLVQMARILATSDDPTVRDAPRAVVLADRAATVTLRGDARILDVLAVSQASAGRFAEAAATAGEALSLARSTGNADLVSELEYRVSAYGAMAGAR